MVDEEYIPVEDAAYILQLTTRQVHRYGSDPNPRLRTRRLGKRVIFHRGDVEALAAELGAIRKVGERPPPAPKAELMPIGEMLSYLRERDQQLADVQSQMNQALIRIGQLQAMLDQRLLPEDEQQLRLRLTQLEEEHDRLQRDLEAERSGREQLERAERSAREQLERAMEEQSQPWWKRLFG